LRRIFRIFPAYYLVLIILFILLFGGISYRFTWLTKSPYPFYSYLFYLQNFFMANYNENTLNFSGFGASCMGVTWSLAIEEQFYLVLPFIIFILNKKHLPIFIILCIFLAPIFRTFIPSYSSYVLLPTRMDSLLIGVLIAHYHFNERLKIIFNKNQIILYFFIIFCFIALFVCGGRESMGGIFIHSILTLLYGSILVLVLTTEKNNFLIQFLSNSVMSYIARISYMIYLTHQVFNGLFHQLILNHYPQINNYKDVFVTLLALITTILFSTISYYSFEKPILSFGKKFNY